jgi:DNA-binding SARP family transcriptional activator
VLFGGFQATVDTGPSLELRARKAHALLAYLALPPGRPHDRDALASLLWGDEPQAQARHRLRQALFVLRQRLGPLERVLRTDGDAIAVDPAAVDVDAVRFERLVDAGTPDALREAADLYRGDLLEGLTVQAPAFEEWLLGERERLRELAVQALASLLAQQRAARDLEGAIQSAVHLLALDPLQETVHRVLMRLYAEVGRRGAALRQYQICRDIVRRELGADPEAETKELHAELVRERAILPAARGAEAPGAGGAGMQDASTGRGQQPSIAALPFREYDAAPGGDYLGPGFVEDIVGALATLPDLFVISRTSSARFRSGEVNTEAAARELGVRYLLTGSVRRSRERMRVVAELSDMETRSVLWTDRVDGSADDLFALQDRLSERIITTIAPYIRQAEIRRALRTRPENLGAYHFMLRGLDLLYRLTRPEFEQARQMFRRSIELDPAYATPYALSALWHSIRLGQGWSTDRGDDFASVERLAAAAIERDPFDARALALAGHVRSFILHDFAAAFALFDRALAANPNSALAWMRSSPTFSYVGDGAEARRRAELGLRLSPLDPDAFYAMSALGLACYTLGDFDQAATWGRRSLAENSRFTANLRILAASLAAAGRLAEAQEVGRAVLAVAPAFRVGPFCEGYAYPDPARREALARHLRLAGLPG